MRERPWRGGKDIREAKRETGVWKRVGAWAAFSTRYERVAEFTDHTLRCGSPTHPRGPSHAVPAQGKVHGKDTTQGLVPCPLPPPRQRNTSLTSPRLQSCRCSTSGSSETRGKRTVTS